MEADHLNLFNDSEIKKIINTENLLLTDKVKKNGKMFWTKNERNFIITNLAIYNMDKTELKRRIDISDLKGITISTISDEFIIHGNEKEYDYLLMSDNKREIIQVIDNAYFKLNETHLLFHSSDLKSIKCYETTKYDRKKDINASKMNINALSEICLYTEDLDLNESETDGMQKRQTTIVDMDKICRTLPCSFNDFDLIALIGEGKGSKVFLGVYQKDNCSYAIKSIDKEYMCDHDLHDQVLFERNTMSQYSNFTFICPIEFLFITPNAINFVMPYYKRGDLFTYLQEHKRLDEPKVNFIACQVAVIIDFFHSKNIILRDLKPENLLIDDEGYLKLCDFGCARKLKDPNEFRASFSGTPEYLSPEVINGDGHSKIGDWWNLGVLVYELFYGRPPFYDTDIERTFDLITLSELRFPSDIKVSSNGIDFMTKLLEKDIKTRLGSKKGANDIYKHSFLNINNIERIKSTVTPSLLGVLKTLELTDYSHFSPLITNKEIEINEYLSSEASEKINLYQSKFNEFYN